MVVNNIMILDSLCFLSLCSSNNYSCSLTHKEIQHSHNTLVLHFGLKRKRKKKVEDTSMYLYYCTCTARDAVCLAASRTNINISFRIILWTKKYIRKILWVSYINIFRCLQWKSFNNVSYNSKAWREGLNILCFIINNKRNMTSPDARKIASQIGPLKMENLFRP